MKTMFSRWVLFGLILALATCGGGGLRGTDAPAANGTPIPVNLNSDTTETAIAADPITAPVLTDLWVDPILGDDSRSGEARDQALRTVTEAWSRIPPGIDLTGTGYRIQLTAGDYREEHLPVEGWMASRYGSEQCPVILNSADGLLAARLHRYLNLHDCRYLSLIGLDLVTDPGYGGGGNVIHLEACRNILLQGCRMNGFDGSVRQPQETLKANQCQYLEVEECDISGAFWFALDFVAVQYGQIVRSRIHDAGDDALLLKGGTAGFLVDANRIYDAGRRGISAGDGTDFDYMVVPWLHYEISDCKFTNNLIYRTDSAGFAVCGGYNILVAFNTLYRIGLDPIGANLLDVLRGLRGCEQADPCRERHDVGGWGPTTPGVEGEWIPNRHVYVFNNIFFNPASLQTVYQHFGFAGPIDPPSESNIPSPAAADEDLRLIGNIVSNGSPDHPLGIGEGSGCQPDNPTCNETLLGQQNRINRFVPQWTDPAGDDFRPCPDGNVATATSAAIPDFPSGDRAQPPLAPAGELANPVPADFNGQLRVSGGPPGALLPASGNTYYVAPEGNDSNPGTAGLPWASPGFGSRKLQPGDTLILGGGTYHIHQFDADIIAPPNGTPSAWVTIRGEEGNRPVLAGSDNLYAACFLSSYLRLENLEITSDGGAFFRGGLAGSATPLQQVILEDLYIHHIDEGALDIRDVDGMEVRDCTFRYCGFGGIGGPAGTAGGIRNLRVENCDLSYSGHYYRGVLDNPDLPYDRPDGFGIEPSEGPIEIVGTRASHNRGDGLDSKAAHTTIDRCTVANNSCDGVKLWAHDSKIINTLIYGTGDGVGGGSPWAGIVIDEVSQPNARFEITNVTLHDNPSRQAYPIYVQYGQANPIQLVLRNTIIANGYGAAFFGDSVQLDAQNNLFYRPSGDAPVEANGREYSAAEIGSGALGSGNRIGDPRFVQPGWGAEGNYHLQTGSPARDGGTTVGAPSLDLDGNARPQGSAIDIGAYEELTETASIDPAPPSLPVRLVFIHHSTGENWLSDGDGQLGLALRDNNYFVSDTNYGWGPDAIGDTTDIGHWWTWFRGPASATYLDALLAESGQHCSYSRLPSNPDPAGKNQIVLFKSCFPNSALQGSSADPIPPIDSNPLRSQDCSSSAHTLANAKGIYRDLLTRFAAQPDVLFVVVTAPPLVDSTWAANARAFNQWLVQDWLDDYPLPNVFVLDFYNVLTSNGGDPSTNDLGWESGNHHRFWQGAVQHKTDGGGNVNAYPSGDDHPSTAGNRKATDELVALLNVAYHRWKADSAPRIGYSPPSFAFFCNQGGSNPPAQILDVWNSETGTLNWTASEEAGWLALAPTSGSSTGEHDPATVSVDASSLSAGTYTATITLAAIGADNSPQGVGVTLVVTDGTTHTITYSLQPNWNMISLPLTTSSTDPQVVFGGLPSPWYLFQWDPLAGTYIGKERISLGLGAGYWLKVPTAVDYSVSGLPNGAAQTPINLKLGWNLIGVPYEGTIPWEAVRTSKDGGALVTLDVAIASDWIQGMFFHWSGNEYAALTSGDSFQSLFGYWVKAKVDGLTVFFNQPY